jgi:hypothetical protein
MLIIIAFFMLLIGFIAIYRHWELPTKSNKKDALMTQNQIRRHSLVGGFAFIVTGIIILSYIIFLN